MKIHLKQILALLIAGLVLQGCEEEVPPQQPVNPDDLRYEGEWQGSTSQTRLISLRVANTSNAALIIECGIGYVEEDIFKQRYLSSPFGLSEITDGAFSVLLPGGGSMSGNFNSTSYCTGKLLIPGASSGVSSAYYFELTTDTNPESLLAPTRIYFEIEDVAYEFIQDDIFYVPEMQNVRTGSGMLVNSSFARQDNATGNTQPIITITAGRIKTDGQLPVFFAPGLKKFSTYAVQGFEIAVYHPGEFFAAYSTSDHNGNQAGSNFRVVGFKEIESPGTDYKLYRFTATFNCKVYRSWGSVMYVENGFYSGYIHSESFQ